MTNRDLRFQKDNKVFGEKVMTSEKLITAEEGINLEGAEEVLQEYKIEKLPIINKSGIG